MNRLSLVLIAAAIAGTAGCGSDRAAPSPFGAVAIVAALSASEVATLEVTVSGAGIDPVITATLVKSGSEWTGTVVGVRAGSGRAVQASARDAGGVLIYQGSSTGITVNPGATAAVVIVMQQVTPPPPNDDTAPIIDGVVASDLTPVAGQTITLDVTAHDVDAGAVLSYRWTATGGTFSPVAADAAHVEWTVPDPNTVTTYAITVTVTDEKALTATLTFEIGAPISAGALRLNVTANTWPAVTAMTASPTSVGVGSPVAFTATTTDPDGDAVTVTWSADCAGSFSAATGTTTGFTPSAAPAGSLCTVTATAADGKGGAGTGSRGIWVGLSAPPVTEAYEARGVPDPAFGTRGLACTQVGTGDTAFRVAVQADGRVLVAAAVALGANAGDHDASAVVRFDRAGALDTSFDATGVATTASDGLPEALAVQGDGKIVVAGPAGHASPGGPDVLIWRLAPDGSLDGTFGTGGRVVTELPGGSSYANALTLLPDGKIVTAGSYQPGGSGGGTSSVLVARFTAAGVLDPSFAGSGWVTTSASDPYFTARMVAVQPDGKIVVAASRSSGGTSQPSAVVLRYRVDGSLDASFDGDGLADVPAGNPHAISIRPDGAILVAADPISPPFGIEVVRLTSAGALDTTFGAGGTVSIPLGGTFPASDSRYVARVAFAPANRLLVVGNTVTLPGGAPPPRYTAVVARFSVDGAADLGFGDAGRVLLPDLDAEDAVVGGGGEIAVAVQRGAETCAFRLR